MAQPEKLTESERDAAEQLLLWARKIAHNLESGHWPSDVRLAEFRKAIQHYSNASYGHK